MIRAVLLGTLAAGCAPGAMTWGTGSDAVRTALWVEGDDALGPWARVFLSTGAFECALPENDDPQEQWEALVALRAGACREDARHVVLTLYADDDEWAGEFPLVGADGVDAEDDRVSDALYVGIDEAAVVRAEGLDPQWIPTEITWYTGAGDRGGVRIRRESDEVLAGSFDLVEAHVSGRFVARSCDGDASLLALLAASPTSACSVDAE